MPHWCPRMLLSDAWVRRPPHKEVEHFWWAPLGWTKRPWSYACIIFCLPAAVTGEGPLAPILAFWAQLSHSPPPFGEPIANPTGNTWPQVFCLSFLTSVSCLQKLNFLDVSLAFILKIHFKYIPSLLWSVSPSPLLHTPQLYLISWLQQCLQNWVKCTHPTHTSNPPHCWPGHSSA